MGWAGRGSRQSGAGAALRGLDRPVIGVWNYVFFSGSGSSIARATSLSLWAVRLVLVSVFVQAPITGLDLRQALRDQSPNTVSRSPLAAWPLIDNGDV